MLAGFKSACGVHEGLWDSPIAGRQTGWHPKCSFFILETAVVSVTKLAANEVSGLSGSERGGEKAYGSDHDQLVQNRRGQLAVNTIPRPAAHWTGSLWDANIHLDTSSY